jgi:hypothetical protein
MREKLSRWRRLRASGSLPRESRSDSSPSFRLSSHSARAFVKAAADYDPKKVHGLDGALRKLANAPYGTALLGIVAAGLFAFGIFFLCDPGAVPGGLAEQVLLEPLGGEPVRLQLVRALREPMALVVEHNVLHFAPE